MIEILFYYILHNVLNLSVFRIREMSLVICRGKISNIKNTIFCEFSFKLMSAQIIPCGNKIIDCEKSDDNDEADDGDDNSEK
jgi:hypothetical protein